VGALLLLPFFFWQGPAALVVLCAALLPPFLLRQAASRALGGITGDVLGASCELAEACAFVAAVAFPFLLS